MKLNFSEVTIRTVKSYTFMTDRFMTVAFNKPVAKHVLSVIMGTDLIIKRVEKQPVMDNFFSRSCCLMFLPKTPPARFITSKCRIPMRVQFHEEPATIVKS